MTRLYEQLIGIPWYGPGRYDEARARMADADRLPPTYDLWREGAEQREHQVRREGCNPRRVCMWMTRCSSVSPPDPDPRASSIAKHACGSPPVCAAASRRTKPRMEIRCIGKGPSGGSESLVVTPPRWHGSGVSGTALCMTWGTLPLHQCWRRSREVSYPPAMSELWADRRTLSTRSLCARAAT
jgi:hypothetical protein